MTKKIRHRIERMEEELDTHYGTQIRTDAEQDSPDEHDSPDPFATRTRGNNRSGLRSSIREHTIPAKFRDNSTTDHVHYTNTKTKIIDKKVSSFDTPDLSLQDYAKLYASIHCHS